LLRFCCFFNYLSIRIVNIYMSFCFLFKYWNCEYMSTYFTQDQLSNDMALLMGTIIFIFFYMVYASGSYWLGCNGMFMIFMNFMPSILLYSLIFQQSFFGILQVMSMFLILSIGADDVFVILDTWGQTNCEVCFLSFCFLRLCLFCVSYFSDISCFVILIPNSPRGRHIFLFEKN